MSQVVKSWAFSEPLRTQKT